jgi:SAM-dependent methyltransferase
MPSLPGRSLLSSVWRRLPGSLRQRVLDWRDREPLREVDDRLAGMQLLCGPIAGKRVLDLGCDSGFTIRRCVTLGAREAIGLNPAVKPRELGPNCRIERVDAARTGLPADQYDLAVSFAAFEHFQRLPEVLRETHRVLRPGGLLYAHFGPIWSGPDGHHLWVGHAGRSYNYLNTTLPPWCHLLMTPAGLLEFCVPRHGRPASERIVSYVYDCPDQNHLFYEDYLEAFAGAHGLRPLSITGKLNARGLAGAADGEIPALLTRLQARYPGRQGFLCEAIEVLMQKVA